jgi:hypothetical protein
MNIIVVEINPVDVESGAYYNHDLAQGFEILRLRGRVGDAPAWSEMTKPQQLNQVGGSRFLALADVMNAKNQADEMEATFDFVMAESMINLFFAGCTNDEIKGMKHIIKLLDIHVSPMPVPLKKPTQAEIDTQTALYKRVIEPHINRKPPHLMR